MKELPPSGNLDISALSGLFEQTTNSYKYLFLLSIVDILSERQFVVSSPIDLQKITSEMLVNAWYPYVYFKLSFGLQDLIAEQLDGLNLLISQPPSRFTILDKDQLRQMLRGQSLDEAIKALMRYVPYRLIRPFFEKELRGIKDYKVNQRITELSQECFASRKPLYCFADDGKSIILHPEWGLYIKNNYATVRDWAFWEWVEYMQRCNPNISDVASKLFPPQ